MSEAPLTRHGDDVATVQVGALPEFRHATDAAAQPTRLRLDQLLAELVERAGEVLETQGRLRGLLDAVMYVAEVTSLRPVLERVVMAACRLVDARYGALGIIAASGDGLSDFITVGMTDAQVAAVGRLPEGHGLLGALISDPRPIRLSRLGADPRSVGFPPDHPPMSSFLGVPVQVAGSVFGNLYLTEKSGGREFTEEDEQLVVALAAAAGMVVQNAQLFEDQQRRQRWAAATADVASAALRGVGEGDLLRLVAAASLGAAQADRSAVMLPEDSDFLLVQAAEGVDREAIIGGLVPRASSWGGEVMAGGSPLIVDEALMGTHAWRFPDDHLEFRGLACVPLSGEGEHVTPTGVLALAYERARTWEPGELQPIVNFARQATVALQLSRAQQERSRLAILEDRDRIARDLHDHVIQRLFATGMTLQSTLRLVDHPEVSQRLVRATNDLDETIKDVRQAIYQLHAEQRSSELRSVVQKIVDDVTGHTGLDARVDISGALNSVPAGLLEEHLLAVLREALTNVVRHAGASAVKVQIDTGEVLTLVVTDDGRGVAAGNGRRSGLANLSARATELGGTFDIDAGDKGVGTRLTWSVPLHHA